MNRSPLTEYAINRFSEPSTWRGLVAMLTSLGLGIEPEHASFIVPLGIGLIGLIGAFVPDKSDSQPGPDNAKPQQKDGTLKDAITNMDKVFRTP